MAFQSAQLTGSVIRRDGQNNIIAIDVDAQIVDDRRPQPWQGRYTFMGDELAQLLGLGPVARRNAIRQRVMQHLKTIYASWDAQIQAENTPPAQNDVSAIAPFTAAEITG